MNIDAFKRTRDRIAAQSETSFQDARFGFSEWVCAAHGCSPEDGGWLDGKGNDIDADFVVVEILELSAEEASHLFWGGDLGHSQSDLLEYLDKVIEKGSVYV